MSYKTIYARITPINGYTDEKYSVAVSGVTAVVDGQKTWSGDGAMNFAITPTSAGTMTVTFKNDTLNQIIGNRVISTTEDITILSISGSTIKTENYESQDYNIIWGMNTWDLFVSIAGRAPRAGEHVYWYVPANTAVVATSTAVGGLHFDERWNVVGKITIENHGIVLGRGGEGTNVGSNNSGREGGTAIVNLSTITLDILNTNIIAGGGRGGSGASGTWNNLRGGYGAPWGGGSITPSFATPGSSSHAGGGVYTGAGSTWGINGAPLSGRGTITNQGSGKTMGPLP